MQPARHPSRGVHPARSAAAALAALAVLALVSGCTRAARARFEGTRPAEALIEVLPPGAQVALDGRPLGPGDRAVPVAPTDAAVHAVEVAAPGYVPERREVRAGALAGARVGVALRPVGYGRPLDLDEADGLLGAALFLVDEERPVEAVAYARRAIAVEPDLPVAHRVLAQALVAAGALRPAAEALGDYLRLAPDAPDAPAAAVLRSALLQRAAKER